MARFELVRVPEFPVMLSLRYNGRSVPGGALYQWCYTCRYCNVETAAVGQDQCYRHLGVSRMSAMQQIERGRGWVAWLCLERALTEPISKQYDKAIFDLKLSLFSAIEDPANERRRPKEETLQKVLGLCPTVVQDTFDSATLRPMTRASIVAYTLLRVEAGLKYGRNGQRPPTKTEGTINWTSLSHEEETAGL